MHRHLSCYLSVLVLTFSWAITDHASAGSFTRGCAARDLEILRLIEDARMVCHAGRVLDAIALYDGIARSIGADTAPPTGRK